MNMIDKWIVVVSFVYGILMIDSHNCRKEKADLKKNIAIVEEDKAKNRWVIESIDRHKRDVDNMGEG